MKKANVLLEGGIILIVLIALVIGIMWISNFFSEINNDVQGSNDISSDGKSIVSQQYGKFNIIWDNVILTLFICMWLASIISAYFIETHPIFFIITIILLCFLLFLSMIIGNAYEESIGDLSVQVASFPKAHFIMTHLLQLMIGIGISIGVALFAKPK
jgi:hypothetical protein